MDEPVEDVRLPDGTRVRIRPVEPGDKPHFVAALERASPEMRRMRFFQPKRRFSDAELAYLTEVDGHDHVAIGALHRPPEGPEIAVGVGRFVRDPERPAVAELAIAIQDDFQHRGLGRALLDRLIAAARTVGVARLEMVLLPENARARQLLRAFDPHLVVRHEDGTLVYEIDLA